MILLVLVASVTAAMDTDPEDNSLWRGIAHCEDMSLDCLKAEFVDYLARVFDAGEREVRVASFLSFRKNDLDYGAWRGAESADDEDVEGPRAASPLQDVVDAVRDKIARFFVTHDVQIALPDVVAEGAAVLISPQGLQDGGALVRLDLTDESAAVARSSSAGTPRLLFKKIRKFIGERLMWALAALVLVVKLLSLKFMFFLPVIMGVAAAKKLLLKVILFVFPFLGHLFKLCPYYAPAKYHHHHHQISHLHHIPPHLHDLHAGGVELDHPPSGWSDGHHHHHHHLDGHGEYADDFGYYADGPAFGAQEFGLRRKQQFGHHNGPEDDDTYPGHGQPPDLKPYGPKIAGPKGQMKIKAGPISAAEIENMVLKAEKDAMLKARLQEEQKRVEVENKRLQDKIRHSLKLQEKLKIQSMVAKQTSKMAAAHSPPPTTHYVSSYLPQPVPPAPPIYPQPHNNPTALAAMRTQLHNSAGGDAPNALSAFGKTGTASASGATNAGNGSIAFDPFYSPILRKIDKIFDELLILDENCRERLVCNMYSEPEKYSPHSNLISAELSRDASELQKPTTSNAPVIRFYKYVQAARDGQDKRACATLYPSCALSL